MGEDLYKKQIKIEHVKLSIMHVIFTVFESAFIFLALLTPVVIPVLANWAGENLKMKIIGTTISFLYPLVNFGFSILFMNLAFDNKDDYIIAGHTRYFDVVWKYRSEILADEKLRKKGVFVDEQPEEHS